MILETMTVKEAADYHGVHQDVIYDAIKDERLEAVRCGPKKILVLKRSVEAFRPRAYRGRKTEAYQMFGEFRERIDRARKLLAMRHHADEPLVSYLLENSGINTFYIERDAYHGVVPYVGILHHLEGMKGCDFPVSAYKAMTQEEIEHRLLEWARQVVAEGRL